MKKLYRGIIASAVTVSLLPSTMVVAGAETAPQAPQEVAASTQTQANDYVKNFTQTLDKNRAEIVKATKANPQFSKISDKDVNKVIDNIIKHINKTGKVELNKDGDLGVISTFLFTHDINLNYFLNNNNVELKDIVKDNPVIDIYAVGNIVENTKDNRALTVDKINNLFDAAGIDNNKVPQNVKDQIVQASTYDASYVADAYTSLAKTVQKEKNIDLPAYDQLAKGINNPDDVLPIFNYIAGDVANGATIDDLVNTLGFKDKVKKIDVNAIFKIAQENKGGALGAQDIDDFAAALGVDKVDQNAKDAYLKDPTVRNVHPQALGDILGGGVGNFLKNGIKTLAPAISGATGIPTEMINGGVDMVGNLLGGGKGKSSSSDGSSTDAGTTPGTDAGTTPGGETPGGDKAGTDASPAADKNTAPTVAPTSDLPTETPTSSETSKTEETSTKTSTETPSSSTSSSSMSSYKDKSERSSSKPSPTTVTVNNSVQNPYANPYANPYGQQRAVAAQPAASYDTVVPKIGAKVNTGGASYLGSIVNSIKNIF